MVTQDDSHKIRNRIENFAESISEFWGVVLNVKIKGTIPLYNWNEVLIPLSDAQSTDDRLMVLLLHEWGHRCIAPQSVGQGYWWEILARLEGIKASGEVINIASDLLVDFWYLKHQQWGELYSTYFQNTLFEFIGDYYKSNPIFNFLIGCYIIKAGWEKKYIDQLNIDNGLIRKAISHLFDESLTIDQRIRLFCRTVSPVFKNLDSNVFIGCRQTKGRKQNSLKIIGNYRPWFQRKWDANELIKLLYSSGLCVPDEIIQEVCGKYYALKIKAGLRVQKTLSRIEPYLERFSSGNNIVRFKDFGLWRIGESPKSLDLVSTLERSGIILPGISTLKRQYNSRRNNDKGFYSMCLIVDNSYSTSGGIIDTELEAAIGLLEACRLINCKVSLIVFGDDISATVEPGEKYNEIELLLAGLKGQSGGTVITSALARAVSYAPKNGKGMATVIFTDSYIEGFSKSIPYMKKLLSAGPTILFCIEDELDDEVLQILNNFDNPPKIIKHKPGQTLIDSALNIFENKA